MSKKMLINATHAEENRVAIVKDGILTELDIEVFGREQTKGNIYKAVVVRVEPGLQAAFVDYGAGRLGFLQMGELHEIFFRTADPDGSRKGKLRITDLLRRGQELLVQVVKGERGTKGAALTTHLSLAGRYMVVMPGSDSKGISRKVESDTERKKLKKAMDSLDLPENMGYIVRTAGIDQSKEELRRDFDYLARVYENILALSRKVKAPALIYKESNLVIRSIRDYFTPDIDEVLVDDPKVMQEAKEFFQQVMPECVKLVKLHQERRPIFSRYQIEEQIETIHKNKVPLPSGGSLVIDRTEALVAIDVNSGKMAGEQGIEATAFRTNLEAAEEAGRQLRLRDLGGLIVIDFIDMRDRKHEREVEKRLKEALKYDKAKVTVGKISSFGLLEMTRQRIRDALAEGTFLTCPHCDGSGRIKSPEAQAVAVLRKIQAAIAKGHVGRVEVELPLEVATYLLNIRRHELLEMEQRHQITVVVQGRPELLAGQVELTVHKREQGDELYLPPVTAQLDAAEAEVIAEEARASVARAEAAKAEAKARAEALAKTKEEGDGQAPATESGEEADAADKKKRKRRRKKKGGEVQPAEGTVPVEETAISGKSDLHDTDESEEPEEGDEEESVTGGPETPGEVTDEPKKKRKRRRRKKKGVSGAEPTQGSAGETAVPAESVAQESSATTVQPAESLQAEGEKKKRKRRRKKKGATTSAATSEATSPASEATEVPATSLPAAVDPVPAVETSPTAPPRRSRAKQPVAAAPEPTSAIQATPEPTEVKPARRRKSAGKDAAEPAAIAEAPETKVPRKRPVRKAGTVNTPVEPNAETSPPKKRAPRKKAAPQDEN